MVLDEATPREPDGRLAFCHICQRSIYFAGGTIRLLAEDLRRAAMTEEAERGRRAIMALDIVSDP